MIGRVEEEEENVRRDRVSSFLTLSLLISIFSAAISCFFDSEFLTKSEMVFSN